MLFYYVAVIESWFGAGCPGHACNFLRESICSHDAAIPKGPGTVAVAAQAQNANHGGPLF